MATKKTSGGARTAVEVGFAAVAAAALSAYLLSGSKHAARNRKQVNAWSKKAKAEVVKRLKNLPEVNEKTYQRVIKEVSAQYKNLKGVTPGELVAFARELQGYWKSIAAKSASPKRKKAVAKARPAAKKAHKK